VFDRDLEVGNEYRSSTTGIEGLRGFKQAFLEQRDPTTGRHINFGPLGSALLRAPFYLAAHAGVLLARALGVAVAADGYSALLRRRRLLRVGLLRVPGAAPDPRRPAPLRLLRGAGRGLERGGAPARHACALLL
jgi:hypothetical protein